MQAPIPFMSFDHMHGPIREELIKKFTDVLDSGRFILGPEVSAFEAAFAKYCGCRFGIGVSSGLAALEVSLQALDIGPGDEVIVPANTYIATIMAVMSTGAKPVLAEPYKDTYNLDPSRVAEAITSQTKAIIPVHLYGQVCDMGAIMHLAHDTKLLVIEDNAQSQGATFNGQPTGSFGDFSATSFYPGKNLGALGDAGAVTTNQPALAEKAALIRNYGSPKKYYNSILGKNARLDELQAALLGIKLPYLDGWNKIRQGIAKQYDHLLKDVGDLVLPAVHPQATHVYHQYVVRTAHRQALIDHCTSKDIGTLIHYPVPPHLQDACKSLGYRKGDFPITEEIAETCLSLPVYPGLQEDEVAYIAKMIRAFFEEMP